jgi:hypothetical protein
MQITLNSKISLVEQTLIQNLGDEAAVLHLESEEYFTLNETGMLIVDLLKECESVQQICDRFSEEYEIEPDQFQQDLLKYLEELVKNDIVRVQQA